MNKHFIFRDSPLRYSIIATSLILTGLGIAELVVTERLFRAFRHVAIQIPGSNLSEWEFVNMDPENIDSGPTTAKFILGGFSLFAAAVSLLWIALLWYGLRGFKMRKLGVIACIAASVNTISSIGFTIYTFVRELSITLPEYRMDWPKTTFTREFFVCEAFPSTFENPDEIFGFRACKTAQAAKWLMVCACCLSVMLSVVVIIQAYESGTFRSRERVDIEKEQPKKTSPRANATSQVFEKIAPPKNSEPTVSSPSRDSNIAKPSAAQVGEWDAGRWHENYAPKI